MSYYLVQNAPGFVEIGLRINNFQIFQHSKKTLLFTCLVFYSTSLFAAPPAFQTGPHTNVGVGGSFPGRVLLTDNANPGTELNVPCAGVDSTGAAAGYTCTNIVYDTNPNSPMLLRQVTAPTGESYYQQLVGGLCCSTDSSGTVGIEAGMESFVKRNGNSGSGIKLSQRVDATDFGLSTEGQDTDMITGQPLGLPVERGTYIFSGFADTRLNLPQDQDVDQQAYAPNFDNTGLVSVSIQQNTNAFGGLFGNGDFSFAGINDPVTGEQISSQVSNVQELLLQNISGGVFQNSTDGFVRGISKWRADIQDVQRFSMRSDSVYDAQGNQVIVGSRTEITQDIHLFPKKVNPNASPSSTYDNLSGNSATQNVWDDYDVTSARIIVLKGNQIHASNDGGVGNGTNGIQLGGTSIEWVDGTPDDPNESLNATFIAQRIAGRQTITDKEEFTNQQVRYVDTAGARTIAKQSGGSMFAIDANNGQAWDWDMTFAALPSVGNPTPVPTPPSIVPVSNQVNFVAWGNGGTGSVVAPNGTPLEFLPGAEFFLDTTDPFCSPGDYTSPSGIC